jgi:epoxyqueuosine reductase
VPASRRVDDERICASFSHKLAANLAGLGWIGKSCLLVTPQAGPAVRWATVLTDAPLEASGGRLEDRCGSCSACVGACPVGAFSGRPFSEGEPREVRYDARACEYYLTRSVEGEDRVCGMSIYACPHRRRPPAHNDAEREEAR